MNRQSYIETLAALESVKAAFVAPPPGGGAPPGMPPGAPMDPAAMGGGVPPGMPPGAPMDPAAMGGMPPMDPAAMGGAMPMDPAAMGGAAPPPQDPAAAGGDVGAGGTPDISQIVETAIQKAMANQQAQQQGAGGAGGKSGKPKIDVGAALDTLNRQSSNNAKMMRALVETLGVPLPPSILDEPPPLSQMGQDQQNPSQPGGDPAAKPETQKGAVQPVQPLGPAYDKAAQLRVLEAIS